MHACMHYISVYACACACACACVRVCTGACIHAEAAEHESSERRRTPNISR